MGTCSGVNDSKLPRLVKCIHMSHTETQGVVGNYVLRWSFHTLRKPNVNRSTGYKVTKTRQGRQPAPWWIKRLARLWVTPTWDTSLQAVTDSFIYVQILDSREQWKLMLTTGQNTPTPSTHCMQHLPTWRLFSFLATIWDYVPMGPGRVHQRHSIAPHVHDVNLQMACKEWTAIKHSSG